MLECTAIPRDNFYNSDLTMKNARRNFFLVFFFFLPCQCLNALAEPITYLWTTTANITFAGKSSNNVPVTIALYADTGDVQADPNGGYEVSGTTVVKIDAIGYARFLVERRIFANSTALGLEGMFALTAPSYYSNYDLQSSMPRQNFAGNGFVTSGGFTAETTAGSVSIGPLSQLAFQAILSTHDSPSLSTVISPISVIEGGSATVSAAIAGAPPFWIQWRKDGADIPYAFGTNLTLTNMLVSYSGDYDVVITNIFGDYTSEKFAIIVNPSRPVITLEPVSQGGVLAPRFTSMRRQLELRHSRGSGTLRTSPFPAPIRAASREPTSTSRCLALIGRLFRTALESPPVPSSNWIDLLSLPGAFHRDDCLSRVRTSFRLPAEISIFWPSAPMEKLRRGWPQADLESLAPVRARRWFHLD